MDEGRKEGGKIDEIFDRPIQEPVGEKIVAV